MTKPFEIAFAEWARRYQAHPESFDTGIDDSTPERYGATAADYFVKLLDELAAGRPWNTIGAGE